ncbi:MAG: hypothetical protein IKD68_13820 [Solobacterium sp.]|nr:hypothetical protein [Solobacterium sp.]
MSRIRETQEHLHDEILEKMRQIGELSPISFRRVMEDEPGLLEEYLRSCGLEVESAMIDGMEEDSLRIKALLRDEPREMSCQVRFIRAGS